MAKIVGNTTATTMMAEQTYNPKSEKPQSGKAVAEAIAKLLGSAPANLDTLEELAKALNEDENFSASVLAEIAKKADAMALANKVEKVNGMGLSEANFTNTEKDKLSKTQIFTDDLKTRLENNTFDGYIETYNEYGDDITEYFDFDSYNAEGIYKIYERQRSDDTVSKHCILCVDTSVYEDVRQTLICLSNGEIKQRLYYGEWKKISVSQTDLNKAIGDIETSFRTDIIENKQNISNISQLFELQNSKNILIPDSESGYYSGTKPMSSANHIRTPKPIAIESGHKWLTVTTNLTEGSSTHYFAVIWLDETGAEISNTSTRTSWIISQAFNGWEIPTNATSVLLWLSGIKENGISTFENFSLQYDNYGIAKFEPYVEPKTVLKKDNLPYGVHPLNGKTIVNFGDSIFGNRRPPNDISTEISKLTGATVHNCGFGGCRMSSHISTQFDAFSMYRLADAIANNDWTLQDTAVSQTGWGMPSYFTEALALLKSIDFSKVDVITIAYGTNDFASSKGLSDAENNKDTTTFAGALRYSIETLLGAYPHLKIFVCSQIYRFWLDDNGEFSADSDTKMFGGVKLTEYVAKTKEVAEEYHIPYIDNYNIGMNKYNRNLYFSATDGTHPLPKGGNLIAAHIVKELF